jgi:hypothetical protein
MVSGVFADPNPIILDRLQSAPVCGFLEQLLFPQEASPGIFPQRTRRKTNSI